jgi:hypothetical protein
MHHERQFKDKVTVHFVKRDDGGLRAICDAVPGFYLSGQDPRAVMRDVAPAIERLFKHNMDLDVEVYPLRNAVYEVRERVEPMAAPEDAIPEEREYVIEHRRAA